MNPQFQNQQNSPNNSSRPKYELFDVLKNYTFLHNLNKLDLKTLKSDTETWNEQSMLIHKSQSFTLYPNKNSLLLQLFIETDNDSDSAYYTPENINTWKLYTGTYDGSNIKLYEE